MLWTALGGWKLPDFPQTDGDYYNLLVRGFRHGTLAMDLEVPEELKRMDNPWDASKRPPNLGAHDVSYYHGRYYLYFGVVPAIVLFWPFEILTGAELPFAWSAAVFGVGAYLVSAWLWLRFLRDQYPRASLLTKLAGVGCLGLVGGQLALERRVGMWEVPIEAGHLFMMIFVTAGYCALSGPRPLRRLAAAGLALGLAIGSRPSLIAAAPALGLLALAVAARKVRGASRESWARSGTRALLAAALPFVLILLGLFAYNYGRFGRWSEFGTTYQLSGGYDYRNQPFSPTFLPHNLFIYFWSRPQWGRYFPFLHPIAPSPQPAGYYGIEYVYGALVICPVLWWGALGWLGLRNRSPGSARRPFLGFLVGVAAGTSLLLLCFNVAAARYVVDFLPWWVWLAFIGWAALEAELTDRGRFGRWVRAALRGVFGLSAAISALLALCASAEVHEILRSSNPAAYALLARVFDAPVGWWERVSHFRGGPLEMTVVFPAQPSGSVEPLVVMGAAYQKDFVYIFYTDARHLQIGYHSLGHDPIQSPLLTVVPGRPYRLHVECGALLPPAGHPFYAGWSPFAVRSFTQWVRIRLDGGIVLDQESAENESAPELLQIGRDSPRGLYGTRFTGTLTDIVRAGLHPPEIARANTGDMELDLSFPTQVTAGRQPLLVAGTAGNSDSVTLRMMDREHFVLAEEIWGAGIWESNRLTVPAGRRAQVRVRLGPALGLDSRNPLSLLGHSTVVWLNGEPVWWRWTPAALPVGAPIWVGQNQVGSSAMEPFFAGRLNASHVHPLRAWRMGPFSAVEFVLGGQGRGVEPLVLTGASGADDLLEIEWLAGDKGRLSYTHGRKVWYYSPIFNWKGGVTHRLRIATPALATLDREASPSVVGRLDVSLDGQTLWHASVPYYHADSKTLVLGGGGAYLPIQPAVLTAAVVDVQQVLPGSP